MYRRLQCLCFLEKFTSCVQREISFAGISHIFSYYALSLAVYLLERRAICMHRYILLEHCVLYTYVGDFWFMAFDTDYF